MKNIDYEQFIKLYNKEHLKLANEIKEDPGLLDGMVLMFKQLFPYQDRDIVYDYLEDVISEKKEGAAEEPGILTLLSLKQVEAYLLHSLLPLFKDVPIETIVNDCLVDKTKPEDPSITRLSTKTSMPLRPLLIHDLVFKVKLPDEEREAYIIVGVDPQNYSTPYDLDIRAQLYSSDLLLGENLWLALPTTKELYKKAVPAYGIFLNTKPKRGQEPNTVDCYRTVFSHGKLVNEKLDFKEDRSVPSLLNTYIVNIGRNYESVDKNIFDLFGKLLHKQTETEFNTVLDKYDILTHDKEERKLLMIGLEQASYDKGSEDTRIQERKLAREKVTNMLTDLHYTKEEINEYLKKYGFESQSE